MATRIQREQVRPFHRVVTPQTRDEPRAPKERADTFAAADHALRSGAVVTTAAPTQTKIPDLLGDWKVATLEATAEELARAEMQPEVDKYVENASNDEEREALADEFFEKNAPRLKALTATHLADLEKHRDRSLQKIVVDSRPFISHMRDPFTPIAQRDPQARAKERVLWENAQIMVIVDLFSPRPKALVVPKAPMMFPVEARADVLHELARVAANVSDAFMDVGGCPAAGIWINPPQHLMVKQLHVHVLPHLPTFSPCGEPLVHAANRDPKIAQKASAFFDKIAAAIEKRLGPSS